MRWIPIDCTIPLIGGLIFGAGCVVLSSMTTLSLFRQWLMFFSWAAPVTGTIWTWILYSKGLTDIPDQYKVWLNRPELLTGDGKDGVDKHV